MITFLVLRYVCVCVIRSGNMFMYLNSCECVVSKVATMPIYKMRYSLRMRYVLHAIYCLDQYHTVCKNICLYDVSLLYVTADM